MPSVIRRLFIFGVPLEHAQARDPREARDEAAHKRWRKQAAQARAIALGRRRMVDRIAEAEREAYIGPADNSEREEAAQIARVLVSP